MPTPRVNGTRDLVGQGLGEKLVSGFL